MNRKALSLLIVVVMVLAVVPAALPVISASTVAPTDESVSPSSGNPQPMYHQVVSKEVARAALNAVMAGQPNMVLIVKVQDGKLEQAKEELSKLGAKVLDENRVLNMLLIKIKPEKVTGLNYVSVLERAWLNKERKIVPPDLKELSSVKTATPSEKVEPKMYNSTWAINALQFIQDIGYDGNGTVVAVLDTGVDPNHPFLNITPEGKKKIIDWRDFTDEGYVDTQYQFDNVTNGVLIINKTFVVFAGLKVNSSTGYMEYVTETLHIDNVTISGITSANGVYHFGLLPERYFDLNFDGDTDDFYPVLLVNSSGNGYDVAYVDTDLDFDFTDEVPLGQYNMTYDVAVFSYSGYGPLNYVLAEIDLSGSYAVFGWDGGEHGTHVAGTIAGYDSNNDAWDWLSVYSGEWDVFSRLYGWDYTNVTTNTTQGVAPGAQIMAVRVLTSAGSGQDWMIINGMTYAATHGADVISMSLGGNAPLLDGTDPESLAVDELTKKYGVVFVIAAGNEGPGINIVGSPGVASGAITVGAAAVPINVGVYISQVLEYSDTYGFYFFPAYTNVRMAFFSSRGPRVDGTMKPDIVAPGYGIYSSLPMWGDGAGFMSGTSMATPHVSGVVALLISGAKAEGVDYCPEKIKKALESGATWLEGDPYLGQEYTELDQGHGLVNVTKSWDLLKAMAGMRLPMVDHWANKSYSDFADYLGVDVIKGLYARNSVPKTVDWHIKYVGDTKYRTFNVYATEPWIEVPVSSITLVNNTDFVLTVDYDTTGLAPGLYVGRIIIDDPTTPVIDDEILNTIVIPENFTEENNYTLKWEDMNGPEMVTHHFFRIPENVDALYTTTSYWDYGLYMPVGMYIFPFQISTEPYVVKAPMPGNWELVWNGWNFGPLYESNYTATIYGVNVTPDVWQVSRVYGDNNTNFTFSINLKNIYAPINASIVAIGLGTYNASIESVADGEYFIKGIEVPEGARQLKIKIGNPSVKDADLDLYLYDSGGNIVALDGNPTADEEIVVDYPASGNYSVVVHGFDVKDENGNPTTTTFDLVVQMVVDNGNIKLNKDSITLGVGENADVTANVTVQKDMPAGVYSGIIELVENNVYQDVYNYWGDEKIARVETTIVTIPITVIVDKATLAVGIDSKSAVIGQAKEFTLTVKNAINGEPVPNATVDIEGVKYTTNENGTVKFNYTATSFEDDIDVTVTADNFVTYEGSFKLTVSEPETKPVTKPSAAVASEEPGANVQFDPEEDMTVKGSEVTLTVNGSTGKTATIMVKLPKGAQIREVSAEPEGHLVDWWTEDGEKATYLFVKVRFASPVTVSVKYSVPTRSSIPTLNFLGYRYYHMYLQQFNELYQKALELGVDNETLQQALSHNETAAEYYKTAEEIAGGNLLINLGDIRLLLPLRQAYLHEMKAVKILQKAVEEIENSEG
ncbi:S8 family serine peptidase [Thermococcus aciditolerans]|uniref:S8 family serine peptidase n=1 Tax=Thermococcus aciditolerans TaxID=2598455 RepID=A0A5C0SJZ5_9EURY|nr:S8 family serine peptidase [Thermococcus aciditolerans]QEK14641.1 S8 family serine peptidase [Thermococcus aciditolerans]